LNGNSNKVKTFGIGENAAKTGKKGRKTGNSVFRLVARGGNGHQELTTN